MIDKSIRRDYGSCLRLLRQRLAEPAPGLLQLLSGPRQVGKTTLLLELEEELGERAIYAAADGPEALLPGFWERLWQRAATRAATQGRAVVLLDEVQQVSDWSSRLKSEWDRIRRKKLPIHVVATGSSALQLSGGSRESLAGRFERLTLVHWSATGLVDAFGLSPEDAIDEVVRRGAYPGAMALRHDEARWAAYVRDAIVEPAIGRDFMALSRVRRPALLRQVFALAASTPSEVVSLQKLQGQLQDRGALETIASYLRLLEDAYLVAALRKVSAQPTRRRASPPKLVPLSNALCAAVDPRGPPDPQTEPDRHGRWVENACIAAHLRSLRALDSDHPASPVRTSAVLRPWGMRYPRPAADRYSPAPERLVSLGASRQRTATLPCGVTGASRRRVVDPVCARADLRASFGRVWADAAKLLEAYPKFRAQLEALRGVAAAHAADTLYVAILGITSSGKSTLINALMGGALLPEESRPTSNLEIRARCGKHDQVRVHYLDGREEQITGSHKERAKKVATLASEKLNPNNEKGVQFIEWVSKRSTLPEGIVLLDTPGLDAYGLEGHAELALSRILPMADIVIYLSSIRNPLKRADLAGLDRIVAHDQRVLVALNQIDIEVDSHQDGVLVKSAAEKLARHERRLRTDLDRLPRLRTCAEPVLISARIGKRARGDKSSSAWSESGLQQMDALFTRFAVELDTLPLAARARRLDARLREIARDITRALSDAPDAAAAGEMPEGALDELEAACACAKKIRRKRRDVKKKLMARANEKAMREAVCSRLRKGMDVDEFRRAMREVKALLKSRVTELSAETQRVNALATEALAERGLRPLRRQAAARRLKPASVGSAQDYLRRKSKNVKVHGWRFGLPPWPEYERRTFWKPNIEQARAALSASAKAQSASMVEHIDWWTTHYDEVYVEPIAQEVTRLQQRVEGQEELRRQAQQNATALRDVRERCRTLARQAKRIADKADAMLKDFARGGPESQGASAESGGHAGVAADRACPDGLESSFADDVADFFRENAPSFFRENAPSEAGTPLRVLLLGARREPRLRLLALLRRELGAADDLMDLPSGRWVTLCPRGVAAPKGHVVVHAPEGMEQIVITVAPADEHLKRRAVERALESHDLVGVDLDVSRVGAGLSDLARAPYADALAVRRDGVFLCSADGALMRHRLSHLLSQVPEALESTPWADLPWLMHEDFDLRYGTWMRLGRAALEAHDNERALVRSWKNEGISFEGHFSRQNLKASYVEALNAMKKEVR